MKYIILASIFIASTALAFYGYTNGSLNGINDKMTSYIPADVLREYTPRHIVIGLDITAGREEELMKDREAIGKIINDTRLGDKLEIYLVHSRAESEQESVFTAEMPIQPGPAGQNLKRAKQIADKDWASCWDGKIVPLMADISRKQQTDLFGFMRYVTTQKPEFKMHKHANLILFTDGQQVGDGYNLEKKIPANSALEQIKANGLLPDMKGISIRFAGVTATHKVTNAHWRQLQDFWKEYAYKAGATSVAVTSDRSIQLN